MKDNFSAQAAGYAQYRPQYPEALFTYLLGFVKEKSCVWDCGTGNGQSAQVLCRYFDTVIGIAVCHPIEYPVHVQTSLTLPARLNFISNILHSYGQNEFL
jgi:hypothetical protein